MIAPAMNTRPQEVLSYRDLARQQARISRRVGLEALPRLKELVDAADVTEVGCRVGSETDEAFEVRLQFSIDARGCSRVEGELSGRIGLACNGCAEVVAHPLNLTFSCVIAETEAIAHGLVEDSRAAGDGMLAEDVLVAGGAEVTVTQIIEDEILLSLPERLCTSEPCGRAPELAYPASGRHLADTGIGAEASDEDENPFSVLAGLKLGSAEPDER